MSGERFALQLREAEDRLRAAGLSGRAAYAALCRHLARRLDLPPHLWLDGPDAPPQAGLDRIPLTAELDLFGLAYERFFPEIFKAERGQYFTPRPLVELMVDLAEVRRGERVLDPACGSGSFLVAAWGRGAEVDGIEVDPELVALCQLNLALLGANPRSVRRADLFREPVDELWDVILANPPFSVAIEDPDVLRGYALARGKSRIASDVLFVEAAWRMLRPGGRLSVVLPHSVLANSSYAVLRAWVDERFVRRALISLPEGVFRPFGGAASRAAIVVLQKRPAELRPWRVARVTNPGFDPKSRTYRRTEPDELALLRLALYHDRIARVPATEPSWEPDEILAEQPVSDGVPTTTLGELAELAPWSLRPSDRPDEVFTEIDLADIDKATGEVSDARALRGDAFAGAKTAFHEGDLLMSRIRPELNNVVLARRPDPALPDNLCGSSEWVRLTPRANPRFTLLAARSPFVRAQLRATGGQTRPRIRAADIPELVVPDPGPALRARMDALLDEAYELRFRARQRMDQVAALYEAFGHGQIDLAALEAALAALEPLSADGAGRAGASRPPRSGGPSDEPGPACT